MSRFMSGNLFLFASMCCATASHILLKGLIDQLGPGSLSWSTLGEFLTAGRVLRGVLAGSLLGAGFLSWMMCLTRLELSYAYPVASTSVLFISLFSVIVLGESLTWRMWTGTALVLVGIILLRPNA